MSDALLSPAVGGGLWVAAAGLVVVAARRVEREADPARVPLMGVMGAFVFAAQMVNFSIPGTGSSGHLGGGLLLAGLLGPSAGFLVLTSVLAVQALFFADGGLLALGANVVNLGASCLIVYPALFRPLAGPLRPGRRLVGASALAGMGSMALGAMAVVAETTASGISALPPLPFLAIMLPVHLAIGLVEGLATAAVLCALWRVRPELAKPGAPTGRLRPVLLGLGAAAAFTAGVASTLAATAPDGLEWSLERFGAQSALAPGGRLHPLLARIQAAVAPFPDYMLPGQPVLPGGTEGAGLSVPGIVGAGLTLGAVLAAFWGLRALRRRAGAREHSP